MEATVESRKNVFMVCGKQVNEQLPQRGPPERDNNTIQ